MATAKSTSVNVTIKPPNFKMAHFRIRGTAPLVIHRFSQKTQEQMKQKMETGKAASSRKNREAKSTDSLYEEARYRHSTGWDGFNASSIRNAMISACRLVGFKMTLAKLSLFIEADGLDAIDGTPLVRINGEPEVSEMMVRNATGVADIRVRPLWREWNCKLRIRYDMDQFSRTDVANLLLRVGTQVGIGEGRPDSKSSNGLGFGLFRSEQQ